MLLKGMKNNIILFLLFIGVIVGIVSAGVAIFAKGDVKPNPKLDAFAKCLAQKGVVMYGAYWCPHCQNQKKLFGESFKYVNYVECTQEVKKCQEKKIQGYPTWIFKDGERIRGEATFAQLAEKSSCKAP